MNTEIQHFILPWTTSSYLGKITLDFGFVTFLVFQCICPSGIFRAFQVFHCFSTYFKSLNLSQTFPWAYMSTPVHFPTQGTHEFFCSKNLQPGHNTLRAKQHLTWKFSTVENHPSRRLDAVNFLTKKVSWEVNSFNKKKNFSNFQILPFQKILLQTCVHSLHICYAIKVKQQSTE